MGGGPMVGSGMLVAVNGSPAVGTGGGNSAKERAINGQVTPGVGASSSGHAEADVREEQHQACLQSEAGRVSVPSLPHNHDQGYVVPSQSANVVSLPVGAGEGGEPDVGETGTVGPRPAPFVHQDHGPVPIVNSEAERLRAIIEEIPPTYASLPPNERT